MRTHWERESCPSFPLSQSYAFSVSLSLSRRMLFYHYYYDLAVRWSCQCVTLYMKNKSQIGQAKNFNMCVENFLRLLLQLWRRSSCCCCSCNDSRLVVVVVVVMSIELLLQLWCLLSCYSFVGYWVFAIGVVMSVYSFLCFLLHLFAISVEVLLSAAEGQRPKNYLSCSCCNWDCSPQTFWGNRLQLFQNL